MHKSWSIKEFGLDTLYFSAGSLLYALSLYTFALHANFAPGGVSGLSILINHYTGLPIGIVSLVLNLPIILVCFKSLGKLFLLKTVWAMAINTLFLDVILPFFPAYSGNPLLASMFTGVLLGAGLGIIYMRSASTGGTDIIIFSIKRVRPHWSVGQISLTIDAVIILAGGIVFRNIDAVLYGIIASFTCTMTVDNVLYGAGSSKLALIITDHGLAVARAIDREVGRGSTLIKATGTYTNNPRDIIVCACSKGEIHKVRAVSYAVDGEALIMITEANEVTGEGFGAPLLPDSKPTAQRKP